VRYLVLATAVTVKVCLDVLLIFLVRWLWA